MSRPLYLTAPNMTGWGVKRIDPGNPDNMRSGFVRNNRGNFNRVVRGPDGETAIIFGSTGGRVNNMSGQSCIAIPNIDGVEVTYHGTFDAAGDGRDVWQPFSQGGRLLNKADSRIAGRNDQLAGAIAVKMKLAPGESATIPFFYAMDYPRFALGKKLYHPYYTRRYGKSGRNAARIAKDAMRKYIVWMERAASGRAYTVPQGLREEELSGNNVVISLDHLFDINSADIENGTVTLTPKALGAQETIKTVLSAGGNVTIDDNR